jgi:hypothetical protein
MQVDIFNSCDLNFFMLDTVGNLLCGYVYNKCVTCFPTLPLPLKASVVWALSYVAWFHIELPIFRTIYENSGLVRTFPGPSSASKVLVCSAAHGVMISFGMPPHECWFWTKLLSLALCW